MTKSWLIFLPQKILWFGQLHFDQFSKMISWWRWWSLDYPNHSQKGVTTFYSFTFFHTSASFHTFFWLRSAMNWVNKGLEFSSLPSQLRILTRTLLNMINLICNWVSLIVTKVACSMLVSWPINLRVKRCCIRKHTWLYIWKSVRARWRFKRSGCEDTFQNGMLNWMLKSRMKS